MLFAVGELSTKKSKRVVFLVFVVLVELGMVALGNTNGPELVRCVGVNAKRLLHVPVCQFDTLSKLHLE